MTKEEHQLVLSVTGRDEIVKLTREIENEEAAILKASAALKANAINQSQWESSVGAAAGTITRHRGQIEALQGATKSYQQNITALGYAVQDFASASGGLSQRLNAISNNLPGVFAGFGSWGLALGAVVPLVAALLPLLPKLWAGLDDGGVLEATRSGLDRLKTKLKELEAKPVKLAVDLRGIEMAQAAIDRMTEGLRAFEALQKLTTGAQQESGRLVGKVVAEAQGANPRLAADLQAKKAAEFVSNDVEIDKAKKAQEEAVKEKAQLASTPAMGPGMAQGIAAQQAMQDKIFADAQAVIDRRKNEAQQKAKLDVGNKFKGATDGDQNAIEALAHDLDATGHTDQAEKLRASTVQAVRAQEQARQAAGDFLRNKVVPAVADVGRGFAQNREFLAFDEENRKEREAERVRNRDAAAKRGVQANRANAAEGQRPAGVDPGGVGQAPRQFGDGGRRQFNPNTPEGRRETKQMKADALKSKREQKKFLEGQAAKSKRQASEGRRQDAAITAKVRRSEGFNSLINRAFPPHLNAAPETDPNAPRRTVREPGDDDVPRRQAEAKELEKALGDAFLALAESNQLGIANDPDIGHRERSKRMDGHRKTLVEEARRQMIRNGMDPEHAGKLAGTAPDFVDGDINRQMNMIRAEQPEGGDMEDRQAANILNWRLQNPPAGQQQQGRRQGFQSVAPTAPGEAQAGGEAGKLLPAFGGYAAANERIVGKQAGEIMQLQQVIGDHARRLDVMATMLENQYQATKTTSYSYAPNHW